MQMGVLILLTHKGILALRRAHHSVARCIWACPERKLHIGRDLLLGVIGSKEGKSTMTDISIVDAVILAGALETEHYEIAVYEDAPGYRGSASRRAVLPHSHSSDQAALDWDISTGMMWV